VDEVGGKGKCLRESITKRHFWALRWLQDAKLGPPGAAGNTVDPNRANRANPGRGRPFGLQGELISESKMEISA